MWWCLVPALALAAPDSPFPREGQAIVTRRYRKVSGDPLHAWNRDTSGSIEAETFADGVVERYRRYDRRRLVEMGQRDALGHPFATVSYTDGVPKDVVVHGPVDATVDVSGWTLQRAAGLAFPAPSAPVVQDGTSAVSLGTSTVRLQRLDGAADVWSDGWRDGMLATCGCEILDRTTTFVDGRAGVRYLVRVVDPDRPRLGEVWAVPLPGARKEPGATLLAAWLVDAAPGGAELTADRYAAALAEPRAMLTLARWEGR